jgi:hypothetical protein
MQAGDQTADNSDSNTGETRRFAVAAPEAPLVKDACERL